MRELVPGPTERPEQLALIYIERLFTAYCLAYGSMVACVSASRVPENAISDLAASARLSPSGALSTIFLLPGLLLLWPRLRIAGLWVAVLGIGVFEVGLIASAVHGGGTATAPVGTAFPLAVASVLLSLHRQSRRHSPSLPGSNAAGRSTDGTSR